MSRKKEAEKERAKVESYIPLDKDDVKHALEIPVKQIKEEELIKIEKPGKTIGKSTKKPRIPKLKTRTIREEEETEDEGIKTKDYILIITEKPQAAEKIAYALGKPRKYSESGAPYYELEKKGRKIIVACAVGHLFTLTSKEKGFPIFNIEWTAEFKKNVWAKKYYLALKKLAKRAKEFIVATDYDIEGEVIGWNIIRHIAKQKDARRMKFSTLTKDELEQAYENLEKTINWGQAIAGETRHFLDWMYGINLSRALMSAIKSAGKFKIMSIGRVQGPALNLIVQKELEIKKFKPEPYWQVFIKLKSHKPELKYEKDIKNKKELNKFKNLEGQDGEAITEKKTRNLQPQAPFDLTSLQREAYRLFGINPSRTLQLAQNLYLAGIISYPRTSSQKIPESVQPHLILKKLAGRFKEIKLAVRSKPIEGKKSDPAHPSIYPTGEQGSMKEEEEKIYLLIVKRFISCFCQDAIIADKKVIFVTDNDKLKFLARGLEIKEKGWLKVYPLSMKEVEIEDIIGKNQIEKSKIEEKQTQPPRRYTPASIITELEKRNLGTKATRASIIETLFNRNYIKDTSIEATLLGINLISALEKYSPIIIDEKLTRHFEKEMNSIQTAKKNLANLQDMTIKEAKKTIEKISQDLKQNEKKVGEELVKATEEIYEQERQASIIGKCPKCNKGQLRILFNRKFRRAFVACSAYPECKTTFSLPPNGAIKQVTDKEGNAQKCEQCSFPKLIRLTKGKRPWIFCFNPACPTNEKWQKKKEEKS